MPVYEFHCKDCRREFKTLKRADQLSNINCPTCGTEKVARLLSVTARAQGEDSGADMSDMGGCMRPGGCCMNPGGCTD